MEINIWLWCCRCCFKFFRGLACVYVSQSGFAWRVRCIFYGMSIVYGFVLFIPASFLGAWGAKYIVQDIPQKKFRYVVAVFLLIIGGVLVLNI